MLLLVDAADDIAKAQRQLEECMGNVLPTVIIRDVGYPGGGQSNLKLHTDGTQWYYRGDAPDGCKRTLNWFGFMSKDTSLSITVEINTVPQGRPGQVAGFFARDTDTGLVYLLHSGRVGGGMRGVGKRRFLEWSKEQIREVAHGRGPLEGLIVTPLSGSGAGRSALNYVGVVAQFKHRARRKGACVTSSDRLRRTANSNVFVIRHLIEFARICWTSTRLDNWE